jgi:hypothetical protein
MRTHFWRWLMRRWDAEARRLHDNLVR